MVKANCFDDRPGKSTGMLNSSGVKMMILKETLDLLKILYRKKGFEPPRLVRIGLKPGWTTVVGTEKLCGTAFRFSGHHDVYQMAELDLVVLKTLVGESLMDIAGRYINSDIIQMRSIAIAAMSALSQPFLTVEALAQRGFQVKPDQDHMRDVVKPDDIVTLIGYGGMVQNVLGRCKELHIADMRSPLSLLSVLIGEEIEYVPKSLTLHGADEDEALLGRSDVAIITASSLVNGTFDDLLRYSAPARIKCLYGPSASIIPDVLIEYGVDFVMSHCIINPDHFIESLFNDANMESSIRNYQTYQVMSAIKGDLP